MLGSGFGPTADLVADPTIIAYRDIPGFPVSSVPGHRGRLVLGELCGVPAAVLDGRAHPYEGIDVADAAIPIHVLHGLGCDVLLVTNASGGINPSMRPGDLMLITDHIDLVGLAGGSPLRGPLGDAERTPFVAMKDAYDPGLLRVARDAARRAGQTLREGIYARVGGPSYETPAELRMLRLLGADAVGMSTTHEVVAARYHGMRVLAISCVTNAAFGDTAGEVAHSDVLERVRSATPRFHGILSEILATLAHDSSEGEPRQT